MASLDSVTGSSSLMSGLPGDSFGSPLGFLTDFLVGFLIMLRNGFTRDSVAC